MEGAGGGGGMAAGAVKFVGMPSHGFNIARKLSGQLHQHKSLKK
jgi:hypothetical protein